MSNSDVIANLQLLHPDNHVEVADADVITDAALLRIDDAQADANAFADAVTKNQTISGRFRKEGKSDNRASTSNLNLLT